MMAEDFGDSAFAAASEAFARLMEEGQRALAACKEQERELRRKGAELPAERWELEDAKAQLDDER